MNLNLEKLVDLRVRKASNDEKFVELRNKMERAENDEELDELTKEEEELTKEKDELDKEIKKTEEEIEEIEKNNKEIIAEERGKIMNLNNKELSVKVVSDEERATKVKEIEERAKALKEGRSITVASSELLVPDHESETLATYPFKPVSSLVDAVKTVNLAGGESYKVAFTKSYGTAGTTLEGADYATAEPTFGYADISKVKVTAYAEITEEVLKLPAVDYEAEVMKNMNVALKKKMAQQILVGDGTANSFKGIFANSVEALDAGDEVQISAITNTTLDDILYTFGGDEEVLGTGVLILNKLDLKAFATLRNTDGTKTYNVDYKNQTIDGIPYIINSNCPSLATAGSGDYVMAYGVVKGYEMPIFSEVEVVRSTDYKFKQGMICYKASVFTGGNVGSYRAFTRIKKA